MMPVTNHVRIASEIHNSVLHNFVGNYYLFSDKGLSVINTVTIIVVASSNQGK